MRSVRNKARVVQGTLLLLVCTIYLRPIAAHMMLLVSADIKMLQSMTKLRDRVKETGENQKITNRILEEPCWVRLGQRGMCRLPITTDCSCRHARRATRAASPSPDCQRRDMVVLRSTPVKVRLEQLRPPQLELPAARTLLTLLAMGHRVPP
jgi:hypothetical protein